MRMRANSLGAWSVLLLLLGGAEGAVTYDAVVCGTRGNHTSPDKKFIYGSNAWNPTGDGYQCLSVADSPPSLDATWKWDDDPTDVHSFPHIRFPSPYLPTRMSAIRTMRATVNWTMALEEDLVAAEGDDSPRDFSLAAWAARKSGLDSKGVQANVAWDFFADRNKTATYNPVDAQVEIMIWLAQLGGAQPLRADSVLTTMNMSGVNFDLYHAKNFREHDVFTWLPSSGEDVTNFDGDLAPMLEYIRTSGLIANDSWLGLVELGSETWYSPTNVTFSAAGYSVTLDNGQDPTSGGGADGDGDGTGDGDAGIAKGGGGGRGGGGGKGGRGGKGDGENGAAGLREQGRAWASAWGAALLVSTAAWAMA